MKDTRQFDEARLKQLVIAVTRRAPLDATVLLLREDENVIREVLERLDSAHARRVFACLPEELKQVLTEGGGSPLAEGLAMNLSFDEHSVGRLAEPAVSVRPETLVAEVVESLRPYAQAQQVVYVYVVDGSEKLVGVVAMRELLFAESGQPVSEVMVTEPFYFTVATTRVDAMKAVLSRHYPVYPVCDKEGRFVGEVRGYVLFEQQTYELTAQAGRMVGVEKEERLTTPWFECLKLRHPWLQLNLLTAFVAGAVVGLFEDTIQQVVALAAFLPVLAGQSGNTGCQALAVTLRSMILNELKPGMEGTLVRKEAILGVANGMLVGLTAAGAMFGYAMMNGSAEPVLLAAIVLAAMLFSCASAGVSGVLVPLTLRKFGADPATASTIFLTTATDVVSMGVLLGLATLVIL